MSKKNLNNNNMNNSDDQKLDDVSTPIEDFAQGSTNIDEHISKSDSLDDEQRIKMLSPSLLVIKRFFRNRLAIIGLIIILAMFVFSFVGGWLHPYPETKIFYKKEMTSSIYASATINQNVYEQSLPGNTFTSINKAAYALAAKNQNSSFTTPINGEDTLFTIRYLSDEAQMLYKAIRLGRVDIILDDHHFVEETGEKFTESFEQAVLNAMSKRDSYFNYEGTSYFLEQSRREAIIYTGEEHTLLTKNIYDLYVQNTEIDFDFKYAAEKALADNLDNFTVNGQTYEIDYLEGLKTIYLVDGNDKLHFVNISDLIITPASSDIFLSIEFRTAISEAIQENLSEFTFLDEQGNSIHYVVEKKNEEYRFKTEKMLDLIDTYAAPSKEHLLGTDGSGMDLLVRLMYGGRVSLTIGFVVVIIEMIIGVILGGLSGYFGGWVDTLLMRLVEIFNCIPTMPLYIILGAALDTMKLDPEMRIYLLMVILGVTGWPGIARVVRGQILSLREQEFMVANEATGISVSRRIFRHLIPNVIPQLIVFATMSLGGIILTEATLSFLNLGVKYPYASWGNIVNAVNDSYVLQTYWFVWIPAGLLILLTVLGFNFVGDGLRDAFDPKMKR